jgi:hypothetical protein
MGCPFPSSDPGHKASSEDAAEAAAAAVSDGRCAVMAESFAAFLPLLPRAAVPSVWYSVRVW